MVYGRWSVHQCQVLLDSRAPPEVVDAATFQWNMLSPCCARPGFARNLRSASVRAEDLLNTQWNGVLQGIALSAHLTVADCELRHARNRLAASSNGRTSYPSFCVSSILDESKLFHDMALSGAAERSKQAKAAQICNQYIL